MKKERPLSPHLTIYKPQITSFSSIWGRISGVKMYLFFAVLGLISAYTIQESKDVSAPVAYLFHLYEVSTAFYIFVVYLTFFCIFNFTFYLLAILRHLIWDFGYCLSLKTSKMLGWFMCFISLFCAILLTIYMFFL